MKSRAWLNGRPFFYADTMLVKFENKIASFINEHDLLGSASKIVLAVSGGADSMALLYAMQALKVKKFVDVQFVCAHVNHQLRSTESDLDEAFVVTESSRLKLDMTTKRVDVRGYARDHKLSIETAARRCRMQALMDIAKANQCDRIATAHQKNDNAETVLHRLVRGTGYRGLGGIWPKRTFAEGVTFIRPMLCVTREEVIDYLESRNLAWRRDHTNTDCTYKRNFIRHRLLPVLQRNFKGSIVETIFMLAQSARRFYSQVCEQADEVWPILAQWAPEGTALDLKAFRNQSPPVKIELIRRSLDHLGCGQRDLTQRHYEHIAQLAGQEVTDKKIQLPGGCIVRRTEGQVIFSRKEVSRYEESVCPPVKLKIPGRTKFGKYLMEAIICAVEQNAFEKFVQTKASGMECFDLERMTLPLSVRSRRVGDRFVPLGMSEEKKIGKFLTAQRVPSDIRRNIILVEDREKVIWVWPIRMSERAKVTVDTRQVLQLKIMDSINE